MANYQEVLNDFKQQWNLSDYNLDELAESIQRFRYTDEFLMGGSGDNSPTGQYVKWFSRTLSIYFAANTTPSEEGRYMSSFDAQAFYNSFKALVQAKYDADAIGKNQKLLKVEDVTDGQKATINNVIANCKRKYQKTLPTMWQENLKKGTLKLDDLKTITDNSHTALENRLDYAEDELDARLTNLIAAREAMKQLRESRSGVWGWLWKVIFNRAQNRQEKEYLQDLNDKISELSGSYNIDEKVAALTGKTVFGKTVTEEKGAKESAKSVKIEPVTVPLNRKRTDVWFKGEYADKCFQAIPESARGVVSQTMLRFTMAEHLYGSMDKHNMKFDEGIANGNDPKVEMQRITTSVFKTTAQIVEAFARDLTPEQRLETTKAIAKVTINTLTAAAVYPDQLGGFVDECIEQSMQQYQDFVDDYWKQVEEQQKESQEKVFEDENPFAENDVHKSAPVKQQPQINAPSIDKK